LTRNFPEQFFFLLKKVLGAARQGFIVDFYEALPDVTIFLHAAPEHHNPNFWDWVRCLRRDVQYTARRPLADLGRF
jgi:hypothetical protein